MKVCTDSCLFGAYVAFKIQEKIINPKNILDIGSGTGLLTLMLAQKSQACIDAIEIERNSFLQSEENFTTSPWSHRIRAINEDVKLYDFERKYDFIISNPPFFENDLKSENPGKNIAKHQVRLTLIELICIVKSLLDSHGIFAVLLPHHRSSCFEEIARENHLYLNEKLLIKQSPSQVPFRAILFFEFKERTRIEWELHIMKEDRYYSEKFIELLKDYYLTL